MRDPNSVFMYWAAVLAARKRFKDVLVYENFRLLDRDNKRVLRMRGRARVARRWWGVTLGIRNYVGLKSPQGGLVRLF